MTELTDFNNTGAPRTPDREKRIFLLKAFLMIFISAVLSRALYLTYSGCATDVTVPPALTAVLQYSALFFSCACAGAAYASITYAVYRYSPSSGIYVLVIFSLVCLADCTVRFASDYIGGELRYREIIAVITLLTEFFAQAAMAICVWMISAAIHHLHMLDESKRRYSLPAACTLALSVRFFVPFIRWIMNSVSFLNDVEWIATSAEIGSMMTDLAVIVLFYGGAVWLASRAALVIVTVSPGKKKNEKIS